MSLTSELLGGAGIAAITQEGISQARGLPGELSSAANRIAGDVRGASEFRPYSVTTGAGGSNFTGSGMTQTLDPQSQQLVDSLRQQSSQQAGMLGGMSPEGLMQQMSALRAPEEQQSADALASLQGSRQLQGMDIQNLSGMLGVAGVPQQQLTAAMQPGMTGLAAAQAPSMLEGQTIANLGQQQLQGIPASINAEALLRQSQMEGLINMLGLSSGGAAGGVGSNTTSAIAGLLGDAGSSIWDSLFGNDGEYSKGDYSDMFGAGVISDGDRAFDDDYENMFGGN